MRNTSCVQRYIAHVSGVNHIIKQVIIEHDVLVGRSVARVVCRVHCVQFHEEGAIHNAVVTDAWLHLIGADPPCPGEHGCIHS